MNRDHYSRPYDRERDKPVYRMDYRDGERDPRMDKVERARYARED